MLGPHTITVVRPGVKATDYGTSTEPDWGNTVSTVVPGCSVQPVDASEVTVDRDNIAVQWVVYVPGGTDILATDRVVFSGDTYDVAGMPQLWDFPPLSHRVVTLRRSTG